MKPGRILLLLTLLWLAACSAAPAVAPPPIDVSFKALKTEATVQEPISFTAVMTNTTSQELEITYTLLGGGTMQQGSQRVKSGERIDAELQELSAKSTGDFPLTFSVEAPSLTPPFKMTEVVTVTIR